MPTFTPPVEGYVPPVPAGRDGHNDPGWRLLHYFAPGPRGVNVFKLADGTYIRDDVAGVWPTTPDVPNDAISWTWGIGSDPLYVMVPIDNPVLAVYYGGHTYDISDGEAAALVDAGFGDNIA